MSGERLTDYQLGKIERAFSRDDIDTDEMERLAPSMLSAFAELRERRAADKLTMPVLTAEECEALGWCRAVIARSPWSVSPDCQRMLAVLSKLLAASNRGGK